MELIFVIVFSLLAFVSLIFTINGTIATIVSLIRLLRKDRNKDWDPQILYVTIIAISVLALSTYAINQCDTVDRLSEDLLNANATIESLNAEIENAQTDPEKLSSDDSDIGVSTESTRQHEWIDTDGDGVEEYVPVYELWEFDLDTIFADPELTEMFFDQSDFSVWDYDTETILRYSQLQDYCIDNYYFSDMVEIIETPYSTCFSSIGYSPIWEILTVTFRDSGAEYYYYDVPQSVGENFIQSESPGVDYNDYIKGQYECDLVS